MSSMSGDAAVGVARVIAAGATSPFAEPASDEGTALVVTLDPSVRPGAFVTATDASAAR